MKRLVDIIIITLPFLALILIGVGLWLVFPPAALVAVGLLIWIDFSRKDHQ